MDIRLRRSHDASFSSSNAPSSRRRMWPYQASIVPALRDLNQLFLKAGEFGPFVSAEISPFSPALVGLFPRRLQLEEGSAYMIIVNSGL